MSDRTQANTPDSDEAAREAKERERRRFTRSTVVWAGRLVHTGGEAECIVLNISINGAKVQTTDVYSGPDEIALEIPRFGRFEGKIVWRKDNAMGIAFNEDPDEVATLIGAAVPATTESTKKDSDS